MDAINNERNGAGVPIAYAPTTAGDKDIADLGALARLYRAGEAPGGALTLENRTDRKGGRAVLHLPR